MPEGAAPPITPTAACFNSTPEGAVHPTTHSKITTPIPINVTQSQSLDLFESLGRPGIDDPMSLGVRPFDRIKFRNRQDNSICRVKPLLLSRKERNSLVHALNGNINKFKRFSDVFFQNIPGCKNVLDIQICLDLLLGRKPSLLAIGEVPHHKLSQCHTPGYHILAGRQSNSKKVRINLLIKDGTEYEEIDLTNEIPTCTIRYAGWTLCFLYREWMKCGDSRTRHLPQQFKRWDTFVPKWKSLKGKSMLIGDLNYCIKNSTSNYQKKLDYVRDSILDNFLLQGYSQLVEEETRFQKNNPPSLLDHLYTNDTQYIERVYNLSHIDSDHHLIGVRFRHDGPVQQPIKFQKRDIKGIDKDLFTSLYLSSNIWEIFQEPDVDVAVFKLNFTLQYLLDHLAPRKTITIGQKQMPWMTPELQTELQWRNHLHQVAQTSGIQDDWDIYKRNRNQLRSKMRKAKDEHTKKHLNVDDTSRRWTRVKDFAGLDQGKRNTVMEIQTDQGMTKSGKVLSKFMNQFFLNKVINLKSKTKPNIIKSLSYTQRYKLKHPSLLNEEFSFKNVDIQTIIYHLTDISNTSAEGVDGITTDFLKKFKLLLAPALLHIVNLSLTQSVYPNLWKTGVITPIPKKSNNPKSPSSWRPIVLNCIMSKLLERVMNQQMMEFLDRNQLDSPSQHAYRNGKSCTSAWIEIDSFVQSQRDQGKVISITLTDQSSAFNVLQKDIVVGKLMMLGFSNSACLLISHYLTGRQTMCKVNGAISSPIQLTSGVGEGSVLGPTLYTLGQICVSMVCDIVEERMYNEYGKIIKTLSCEYADDVSGLISADDDETIQLAVDIMMETYTEYFSSCGLCLNQDKCMVIVLRSKAKTKTIYLEGKEEVKKAKLLGVWLDSRYQFFDHLNHVIKTCTYKLTCLRKVSKWLTKKNLKAVVESLVLSQIFYCSEVYMRLQKVRTKVQKLVNSAARLVLHKDRYANCATMMKDLDWLNMDNHHRTQLLSSLRRLLRTRSAPKTFRMMDWSTNYGSRRKLLRLGWKWKGKHGKHCYIQSAVREWNAFKLGTKVFPNDKKFKEWICQETIRLHGNQNLK